MRALVDDLEGKPIRGRDLTNLFRQCALHPMDGTTGIDFTLSRSGDDTGYVMRISMTTHCVAWPGGEGGFILSGDGMELVDAFLEDQNSWWPPMAGTVPDCGGDPGHRTRGAPSPTGTRPSRVGSGPSEDPTDSPRVPTSLMDAPLHDCLDDTPHIRQHGDMRTHPARWGSTTTLGFVPALVSLVIANWMHHVFGWVWLLTIQFPGNLVMVNQTANAWLLGVAAAAYTIWILALARGWITAATGGGFVIAAHALILRIVVELPQSILQIPLAEALPPEPYATVLPLARAFGLVAFVAGLAFVAAAVLSERRLRRMGTDWAFPP